MLFRLLKKAFRNQSVEADRRTRLEQGYSRLLADDFEGASEIALGILTRYPDLVEAHLLHAQAAAAQNRWDAAIVSIGRILVHEPRHAEALYVRGLVQEQRNRFDSAIADFAQALAIDPAHTRALERKGALHDGRGEFDDALACAQQLVELDSHNALAYDRLGITLRELGLLDDAARAFQQALALDPKLHTARCHLALVCIDQGRFREAEAEVNAVLAVQGAHPDARWTRAICSLLQGRFESAWEDYEYRDTRRKIRTFLDGIPEWNGEALRDGALLIYAEQGLGDHIMFASCLSDVLARSPICVVECDPKLQPMFQRSFPEATVVASPRRRADDWVRLLPVPVTAQMALGSLPKLFRRSRNSFPPHRGYLYADPAAVAHWSKRLHQLGAGLKVGLSWIGGTAKTRQRFRSMRLEQLMPILHVGECQFVNLQYTDSAVEMTMLREEHGIHVHDFEEAHASYDETAALVGALDLVITVSTAVAHLAGALGKPVWIMTPATPDWCYLAADTRMPWYPEARVWRQRQLGDWSEVIDAIAIELAFMAKKDRAPTFEGH